MLNLALLDKFEYNLPESEVGDQDLLLLQNEGERYFLSKTLMTIYKVENDQVLPFEISLVTSVPPQYTILGTHMQPFEQNILVVLSTGDLLLLQNGSTGFMGDVIGSFPSGIVAFKVSSDNEVITLITAGEDGPRLVLMSRSSFSVIKEVSLDEISRTVRSENVNVGWGRKETQFHGKAGKQAALNKVEIKESLTSSDDGLAKISWRPDSQHFAISFVDGDHREIIMFTREGECVAKKEITEGLGHSLAWRMDGTLIASHTTIGDQTSVVFFERNGLAHGGFLVPTPPPTETASGRSIVSLSWNKDGCILSILFSDGNIEFWTCSNYHWSLKYSLGRHPYGWIYWDEEDALSCFVSSNEAGVMRLKFIRRFYSSPGDGKDFLSLVATVEGTKLKLTPFAIANVPPPMSFYSFIPDETSIPISVAFKFTKPNASLIAIALSNDVVLIFEIKFDQESFSLSHSLQASVQTENAIKQVVFDDEEPLLYVLGADGTVEEWDYLNKSSTKEFINYTRLLALPLAGCTRGAFDNPDVLALCEVTPTTGCFYSPLTSNRSIFVLSEAGILIVDDVEISTRCKSVALHPEFLCTSDPEGLVRFYPINLPVTEWPSLRAEREENARLSEGGALIVSISASRAALVLQMPRGNLETVYPRAFVLSQVKAQLNSLNYKDAFLSCRRHRLDLNIIHDNNPELFVSTLPRFLQQVTAVDHINLFMSSLRDENVVVSRYSAYQTKVPAAAGVIAVNKTLEGKVNMILDKMRGILSAEPVKYAECIMTAFVCRQPPNHQAALETIVALSRQAPQAVEKALKYLIFLVPAEQLYRVALGMYNLPLALSVAKRSQMDPSEYVEFLNQLHQVGKMDYRAHLIDDFLQRYPLALKHLVKCMNEDMAEAAITLQTVLSYAERHNLYREAMGIFEEGERWDEWKQVCSLCAACMAADQQYSSAADLYAYAGDLAAARRMAVQAGKYAKLLTLQASPGDIREIITVLMERKQFADAAKVAEITLPAEEAFMIAVDGGQWLDAIRFLKEDNSRMKERLVSAAEIKKEYIISDLQQLLETFQEKAARYLLLQGQLNELLHPCRLAAVLDGDTSVLGPSSAADGGDLSDAMSMLSFRTGTTMMSALTGGSNLSRASTAKSKKKAERQKMKGKQGSPYEREYLRDTLKTLIAKFSSIVSGGEDCNLGELMQLFAEVRYFSTIREVQRTVTQVTGCIRTFSTEAKRLLSTHEERLRGDTLASLGISPHSIPELILIDYLWKTAFDLPSSFPNEGFTFIPYIL